MNLPKIPGIEEPFDPPHRFVSDRDTVSTLEFLMSEKVKLAFKMSRKMEGY